MKHSHHGFLHRKRQSLRSELGNLFGTLNNGFGNTAASRGDGSDSNSNNDGPATVVSVVVVTESATFTGPTASLITKTGNNKPATVLGGDISSPTVTVGQPIQNTNTPTSQTAKATTKAATTAQNTQTSPTAATTGAPAARSSAAQSKAVSGAQSATSASSATSTPTQDSTSSPSGMSGGAKAGVAFGVILALALVGGIIFFVVRRKKQQQKEDEGHNLDNEKSFFAAGGANHAAPPTKAPRLSLRPVTQFLPGIGEPKVTEMTSATGGLQPYFGPGQHNSSNNGYSRPSTANSNHSANPFGQNAERLPIDPIAAEKAAENAPIPVPATLARSTSRGANAALGSTRTTDPFADKQDARSVSPEVSPPSSIPGSPPKTEFGTAAAVAVGAAGAAAAAAPGSTSPKNQPNNVHRVQLDFKPSMDDELELRSGSVVRMLHEYDDGWALCMLMDRSRQGVAPRTCLSKMPVKPRPAGPPPGMRPIGRPQSPGMRNFSGPPGHNPSGPMYPAPLSPSLPNMNTGRGPNGPSPPHAGRARAQSQSQSQSMDYSRQNGSPPMSSGGFQNRSPPRDHRRSASVGTMGVPVRKPVPGQAM